MFSKFSVIVLQLILCTFRGADQHHFAEIAKAISSETGINESEVLDLFAKANALEKRLESVEKTKQMLKLDQSIQQDRDDQEGEEGGEDRAGGTDGAEADEQEGVDATRQERVPISAEGPVVKAVGDPVLKAVGDPVLKAVGDPVLKAVGDPVVKAVGDPVLKAVGDPVVKTVGDPVVKASEDPSLTNVTQVEEPGNVSPSRNEGKTNGRRKTGGRADIDTRTNLDLSKNISPDSEYNKASNMTEVIHAEQPATKDPGAEKPGRGVTFNPPKTRYFSNIDAAGGSIGIEEVGTDDLLLRGTRQNPNLSEIYVARNTVEIADRSVPKSSSLEADLRGPTAIPARRLAGSNKKRRASRVELLVHFLSSGAEKAVENLKRDFGKNFEKVTALNFKKFKSDVLKAGKKINDTETVLKLHGTVVSKTEDVKKSNATALGLGLGLGLGLPALIAVVFIFLIKTNRLLLNFGFSSDNFTDNGSMV